MYLQNACLRRRAPDFSFLRHSRFKKSVQGQLTSVVLYQLSLDIHTGLPALADGEETKIIYDYLSNRNEQLGTVIDINGRVIEVKIK